MEYVNGKTLREIFKNEKLSVVQSLEIAIQIAKALEAAHKKGIIHRDIKPENIMLASEDNTVKVLDFGLAKYFKNLPKIKKMKFSLETDPKFIIGTTAYMSPEQIYGERLDERTDLWSFGVLLFEMLLGKRPFDGATPVDIQSDILKSEPAFTRQIKDFPMLKQILSKLLTKQPDERYQAAADLKEDLRMVYRCLSENRDIHLSFGEDEQPETGKFENLRQSIQRFIRKIISLG